MSTLVEAGVLAKSWLGTLAMLAAQGTLLALIAVMLTRAGKLRPSWHAAIWLVVMIKLALPWGPGVPFSLSDLVAQLTASTPETAPFVLTATTTRVAPTYNAWPAVGWIALAAIWTLGASIVLSRAVLAQWRTSRAAHASPAAPSHAQQLLAALHPRARLVVGASDVGPHVVGMLRPIIVVPAALLDDPALLRAVLLHELAHVRRGDAIARVFQIAARVLLWWWPVVRVVNRKLELAREAACDAWALSASDVARPTYARLLVRMASLRMHADAHALAAPRALDARVAAVLGPPSGTRMNLVQRFALVLFALVALGGARSATASKRVDLCTYTTELATALYDRFPDADVDGDGFLSRAEACDLQATLRQPSEERMSRFTPDAEAQIEKLLAEPLNCELEVAPLPEPAFCQKAEGPYR